MSIAGGHGGKSKISTTTKKKFDLKLPGDKQEQKGGVIPPEILQNLKPVIAGLGPKKK